MAIEVRRFTHHHLPIFTEEQQTEEGYYYFWDEDKTHGPFKTREKMQQDMIIRGHVLPDMEWARFGIRGSHMIHVRITLNDETQQFMVGIPVNYPGLDHFRSVPVTENELYRYIKGELAQNVWGHLDPTEREFLISGIYADDEEWEAMFRKD